MTTYIFVDLDGTIMLNPFGSAVFPAISAELAEKTGLAQTEILQRIFDENTRRITEKKLPTSLIMDWDDIFQTVARTLGVSCDQSGEQLVRQHVYPPHVEVLHNAIEVLAELKHLSHRRLIVATQGLSRYQHPVLETLNLLPLFDDVLAPDLVGGYGKTDSEFYARYMGQRDAIYISIGDTYLHDVYHPQRFGFHALWLPNEQWKSMQSIQEIQALDPFERSNRLNGDEYPIKPRAILLDLQEASAAVGRIEQE